MYWELAETINDPVARLMDLRQGLGPSLSRAVSAPVVLRHYIVGTLMVNLISITLTGTPWVGPTLTKD